MTLIGQMDMSQVAQQGHLKSEDMEALYQKKTNPWALPDLYEPHYLSLRPLIELLSERKDTPSTVRVAEFGCGEGYAYAQLGRLMREFGIDFSYKGFDISPTALKTFESRYPGVVLQVADLEKDTQIYSDIQEFDLVIFLEVLYYLHEPCKPLRLIAPEVRPETLILVSDCISTPYIKYYLHWYYKSHVTLVHKSSFPLFFDGKRTRSRHNMIYKCSRTSDTSRLPLKG